jgi:hypothetical protein
MPEQASYQFEDETADNSFESEDQQNKAEEPDEKKLSANEVRQIKAGSLSIQQVAQQRMQLKAAAEAEMNGLVTAQGDRGALIDLKEYKGLKQELETTESAEETAEILKRIKAIPKDKETEQAKKEDEKKELSPDNPKLLKLQRKFGKICEDNVKIIGSKQIPGFKAWFAKEMKDKPTIDHLNNLIKRLEGKEIKDKNGLEPRRTEYNKLVGVYQKYGISDPTVANKYLREEGLSERQDFRKQLEATERHFENVKDTPFYDRDTIQKRMKENLSAKNPNELKDNLLTAKNVFTKEAEGFTYLDSKMTVAGRSVRKMSEKSKKMYLEYYRTTDFKERKKLVSDWKELVNIEGRLATELSDIYGNNTDGLKLALQSFEEKDFMEKKQSLKDHKKLVEKSENKEELEKGLTIKAANAKIDAAAAKKIISKSTQNKYREWFGKDSSHKDSKTGKYSLQTLKKHFDILVNKTPDGEARNLSAYEIKRKRFQKEVEELKNINPSIEKKKLDKWNEDYNKESWTGRKKVYKKLKTEHEKAEKEAATKRKLAAETGIDEKELESKENSPKLNETISAVTELMNNNQGAEAMKLLLEYNESDPDNPKILFWMNTVAQYMKEFGSGKKMEENKEKELDKEMEDLAANDDTIKDDLEENQIRSMNIRGAQQSEDRHDKNKSAHERAKKESMGKVSDGSLEADLTEDAYDQMGDDYILNKKGTGEKVEDLQFNNVSMIKEDKQKLKRKTYQQQIKLDQKEGFTHANLLDKTGRQISAREAEVLQEQERAQLASKLAEKGQKNLAKKTTKTEGAKILDFQAKAKAMRQARKITKRKEEEHLKEAA